MEKAARTKMSAPLITSGDSCRSGCAPAEPYPATDTIIIDKIKFYYW